MSKKAIVEKDQEICEMVEKSIDSFAKETAMKRLTPEKITEFYDKLLSNLVEQEYLTKEEVENIKKSENYKDQIERAGVLINNLTNTLNNVTDTVRLEDKEIIYYHMARFTKAIGLSKISDYFMKKIEPEKVQQIDALTKIDLTKEISNTLKERITKGHSNKQLQNLDQQMQQREQARRSQGGSLAL